MSEPFLGEIRAFGFNFCPRGWMAADGQILLINDNQALYSLYGTTYGGDGRMSFGLPDLRGRVPIHNGWGPGLSNYPLGQRSGAEQTTLTVSQLPSHNHAFSATGAQGTLSDPSVSGTCECTGDGHSHTVPNHQHGFSFDVCEENGVLEVIALPADLSQRCRNRFLSEGWRCQADSAMTSQVTCSGQSGTTDMLGDDQTTSTSTVACSGDLANGQVDNSSVDITFTDATIENTGAGAAVDIRQPYLAVNYCVAVVGIFPSRS